MFGIILSGRPVLTTAQTISPTQFAFPLSPSPPFTHIVVFLLPGVALPPDTAAAVYIQIPPAADFRLLGAIANEKQSAIFKVNAGGGGGGSNGLVTDGGGDVDAMVDDAAAATQPAAAAAADGVAGTIMLGISIEPVAAVSAALAALKPPTTSTSTATSSSTPAPTGAELVKHHQPGVSASGVPTKVLAQRIIANAFNFLASFAGSSGPGGVEVVPLKSFQDWWAKFERRVERDPGFLEREEGG